MMRTVDWTISGINVQSHGNGLAYTVTRLATGENYYLQGEDADTWRAHYDSADESPDETFLAQWLHQSFTDYGAAG